MSTGSRMRIAESLLILLLLPTGTFGLNAKALERLETVSPTSAVLFPWVVEIIGVIVFFLLTRFEIAVPYAAIMFLIGVAMGYGALAVSERLSLDQPLDQMTASTLIWSNINSGVLLLVFLPGLIFRDAIEVKFNLFVRALPQILILAFPMVLVGTVLVAVVGYYAYGWPLALAATLGSILSSTDPVAVGSVLKSAGAPPRLQMHISGESLLNDGSAVVFYSIFSAIYLADLGEGSAVGWGEGIATFFRMALGGTAVGLAFAVGLLIFLHELDRRLEPEYNVLQVVAALTVAYLSYYVSEQVCLMSGVIACVVCGVAARALGRGMITDNRLMDSYLALMEYLLNTLLFTLGGVVYGKAIRDPDRSEVTVQDFLLLGGFYLVVMGIRMFQVTLFYPIFSRVGLKSNWSETMFLGFGGLRGAVAVALALALERRVRESFDDPAILQWTREVEFFSGGVTFLTLFVNGTAAGSVLKFLGLAKPLVSRKRTLRLFKASAEDFLKQEFASLMEEKRYMRTDIRIIRELVPFLSLDLQPPKLEDTGSEHPAVMAHHHVSRIATASRNTCPDDTLQEIRGLYLDLLNEAYTDGVMNNELDEREDNGFNFHQLRESVALAAADNDNQVPINDWEYTEDFVTLEGARAFIRRQYQRLTHGIDLPENAAHEYHRERTAVLRAISFIYAHDLAEKKLDNFVLSIMRSSIDEDDMGVLVVEDAIETVLEESAQQVAEAQNALNQIPSSCIDKIVSNHVATILLRRLADFIEKRATDGFLTKKEARLYLDQIDQNIRLAHDGKSGKTDPKDSHRPQVSTPSKSLVRDIESPETDIDNLESQASQNGRSDRSAASIADVVYIESESVLDIPRPLPPRRDRRNRKKSVSDGVAFMAALTKAEEHGDLDADPDMESGFGSFSTDLVLSDRDALAARIANRRERRKRMKALSDGVAEMASMGQAPDGTA